MAPRLLLATIGSALLALAADAQEPLPVQEGAEAPEGDAWEFSLSAFYSDPPGSEGRLTPILYADRGRLHLEARYQYEDLDTLSLFAGANFAFGEEDEVEIGLTPMIGGATGDTAGIIPALELDVGWKRFAWYVEAEYLFDLDDSDDSYFYSWSTLTYAVTDWLDAGLVVERNKLVDTDFDVQPGLAVRYHRGSFGAALYTYDIGTGDTYATLAVEFAP